MTIREHHKMLIAFVSAPKPQCLYVHRTSGEIGRFDSWAKWPIIGFYRLSSGRFEKFNRHQLRAATVAEEAAYERARKSGVEAAAHQGEGGKM